eukprot:2710995-Pleurochrysis_carterae.AAC.2
MEKERKGETGGNTPPRPRVVMSARPRSCRDSVLSAPFGPRETDARPGWQQEQASSATHGMLLMLAHGVARLFDSSCIFLALCHAHERNSLLVVVFTRHHPRF